jgi:hypothetical protein
MDERERRIGLNEAVFREANEALRGLNETFAAYTEKMELVCECGDGACAERITMSPSEYEEIRSDPAMFAIAAGHEVAAVEQVVRKGNGYDVVRKRVGSPRRLAEATDPRSSVEET